MRIAVTCWGSRVSPLYDTARKIIVVDTGAGGIQCSREVDISLIKPFSRAGFLHGIGVEVLICGGISDCLRRQLLALNVKVVPWVSGEVSEVINIYIKSVIN